jgi:hypothetical protein
MQFLDEWLVPTVEPLLPADAMAALRQEVAPSPVSLWETAVQRRMVTDDQVLGAIATRFRLPLADLSHVDARVTGVIPEQLARRFTVVPVGQTDSYLEVATANPFDIDAEKMLAFATGREVRMLLASPGRLRAKLDEIYRSGEEIVSRLLAGIDEEMEVKELADEETEYASAEEASQRPIIRLVDMMPSPPRPAPSPRRTRAPPSPRPCRCRRGPTKRPAPFSPPTTPSSTPSPRASAIGCRTPTASSPSSPPRPTGRATPATPATCAALDRSTDLAKLTWSCPACRSTGPRPSCRA